MALIKCKECGKEISDKATACIRCGNPIKKQIISNKNWKELTSQEKNIIKKDLEEKNDKLTTKKSLVGLIIGVIIGVITMLIFFYILQVVKTNINISKCKSGYTYDETYNLCTQRERTLRDENGNCPNGFGYNDYDYTCVRYNEYKP